MIITAVLGMLCACQGGSFSNDEEVADSVAIDSSLHIAIINTAEAEQLMGTDCVKGLDSLGIDVTIDTFFSAMDADTAFLRGHAHMLMTDSVKVEYLKKVMKEMSAQGTDAQDKGKEAQGTDTQNKGKAAQGTGEQDKKKTAPGADEQYKGKDSIIVLHNGTLTLSLMTTKSSRIKNIKSLKDKNIAVTRNSAVDYIADKIMTKAQLPQEAMNRPQINDLKLRKQMLILGQYDGAIMPEPYATECEDSGANRVFTATEPLLRVITTKKAQEKFGKEMKEIVKMMKAKD